ncbi:low temperature requirement protein A [Microbacterium sp. KSW-18]|uniref:Low temperature requirement protein A n=1 Tax=Microbacterium aquilitoris TaxID=3067307 RepID=A0ABU3GL91_9MICO|nr:low temperature requirement protein A [Microbacterium sp. KSW-18]MDT3331482.1 low temperature requirement protein A [Microbacterium sp. KSW-18]
MSRADLRLVPMTPRDPHEPARAASSLELFFDLVFVVAVSISAVELHHALTGGHIVDGVLSYAAVFFSIWWAWMNFTWFATAFDTDDWPYRLLTIVQMGGVLVLAAGVHSAFADGDFRIVTAGYVVMRLAMVAQWIRAFRGAGPARAATVTYAVGITAVQVLWVAALLLPVGAFRLLIVGLILAELAVPVIAESRAPTPRNAHHITERYGLFTLILLGESLLASANAVIHAVQDAESLTPLIGIAVLTLAVTAALWWIYFWPPHHLAIDRLGSPLLYGYGHYFVFAAAGAFSAGIEVEIDVLTSDSALMSPAASFTYTVPIAIFIGVVWLLAIRPHAGRAVNLIVPSGAVLVLIDPLVPVPVALTAVILAGVVAALIVSEPRAVNSDGGALVDV